MSVFFYLFEMYFSLGFPQICFLLINILKQDMINLDHLNIVYFENWSFSLSWLLFFLVYFCLNCWESNQMLSNVIKRWRYRESVEISVVTSFFSSEFADLCFVFFFVSIVFLILVTSIWSRVKKSKSNFFLNSDTMLNLFPWRQLFLHAVWVLANRLQRRINQRPCFSFIDNWPFLL